MLITSCLAEPSLSVFIDETFWYCEGDTQSDTFLHCRSHTHITKNPCCLFVRSAIGMAICCFSTALSRTTNPLPRPVVYSSLIALEQLLVLVLCPSLYEQNDRFHQATAMLRQIPPDHIASILISVIASLVYANLKLGQWAHWKLGHFLYKYDILLV